MNFGREIIHKILQGHYFFDNIWDWVSIRSVFFIYWVSIWVIIMTPLRSVLFIWAVVALVKSRKNAKKSASFRKKKKLPKIYIFLLIFTIFFGQCRATTAQINNTDLSGVIIMTQTLTHYIKIISTIIENTNPKPYWVEPGKSSSKYWPNNDPSKIS